MERVALAAIDREQDSWGELYTRIYNAVGGDFAETEHNALMASGKSARPFAAKELEEDVVGNATDQYVGTIYRERWPLVASTTKAVLTRNLRKGIAAGKDVDGLVTEVKQAYNGMSESRARRIARTETIAASNFGSIEGARATGLVLEKKWSVTKDSRARTVHTAAGMAPAVDLEAPFVVGGERLLFPGDTSFGASAWNVVNCRCTTTQQRKRGGVVTPPADPINVAPQLESAADIRRKVAALGEATPDDVAGRVSALELSSNDVLEDQLAGRITKEQASAKYKEITGKINALYDSSTAGAEDPRSAAWDMMTLPRDRRGKLSVTVKDSMTRGQRARMGEAADFMERVADKTVIDARRAKAAKEVVFQNTRDDVTSGLGERAHYQGLRDNRGLIHVSDYDGTAVYVHELGHHLDNATGVAQSRAKYYRRRTQGGKLERLRDVTGEGFNADEVTMVDKWRDPYTGKWYGPRQSGEVNSMGVQWLYEDPVAFAREDPDHFEFTLRMLRRED